MGVTKNTQTEENIKRMTVSINGLHRYMRHH